MQRVFVELESTRVDLAAWEEVYWALLILQLDVLVIANQKACLRQFENVLDIADGANHLTGCHVFVIRFTCDRSSLNLLGYTVFAQRVATEEYAWQVWQDILLLVSLYKG